MATKSKAAPKKTQEKPVATDTTLHVALVVDMSGSMASVYDETVVGMNQYISDLKETEGETLFSLTAFDTVFEQWYTAKMVQEIPFIGKDKYRPRGMTALYDAIANTIVTTEEHLKALGREDEKVLVVVITDGMENSSQDYSLLKDGKVRLFDLIRHYEAKGNWTFSYIGAGVDSYSEAGAIGISPGNAVYASASPGGTATAYNTVSEATRGLKTNSGLGSTQSLYADSGLSNDIRDEDDTQFVMPEDSKYQSTATDDIKKARSS